MINLVEPIDGKTFSYVRAEADKAIVPERDLEDLICHHAHIYP